MERIRFFISEFKSIFVTDDLFKENESHANVVAATTMFNMFVIFLITYFLTFFNVFKLGMDIVNNILIRSILLLAIPAIICFIYRGKKSWLKTFLFVCFTIMLAYADAVLKYNVTLVMCFPVIMAARYYNRRFTLNVAIITAIAFAFSTYLSLSIGQQDINTYNLVIPEGTTFTVNGNLRDEIVDIDVNENERLRNTFIHFFLPKLFLYNIIVFACVQISQSGKKMIEYQDEISKKGARIETELNLANGIQKAMLPSIFPPFPEHEEIDIFASMIPAKEVAGDFYDMFLLDDNHLGIVMADVSGKGIPAALFMMISKTLIKNVSTVENDVQQVFNRVNRMLCDGNGKYGLFVTAWFGVLNLSTGLLSFVNAGHNPPLLYTKNGNCFQFLKTKPNLVLAGMNNTNYTKHEIQLEPEDRLFLYTDGVVEATNSNNQLYGEDRLIKFLDTHMDCDVKETLIELKKDIDVFVGNAEQFDDITMLELLYKKRKVKSDYEVEKRFRANVNELPNVQQFAEETLQRYGCDKRFINQINLVIEEIFVNIAHYAYPDASGMCNVYFDFNGDKTVQVTFKDQGIPFNPLEKDEPDITLPAEERKVGGLGIYITKKIMDKVEYRYENYQNILKMKKNMS